MSSSHGTDLKLQTENLELVLQSPEEVLARIESMSPADQAEISPEWLDRVRASTQADQWTHGFAVVHRATRADIGNCGYKGPPASDGGVEIAYGIDPDYQGYGYATEAVRALVAHAHSRGVRLVRAHTLPVVNASTRVLTKCCFERVGEVEDPEDGRVWRWEWRGEAVVEKEPSDRVLR